MEAVMIGIYGQQALDALMWFLDNEILLAIILIIGCVALWWAWSWWDGLQLDPKEEA
jgi:predicted negative regulator of RcsB-dependent stress response